MLVSVVAGGTAGMSIDAVLFPIDTIKTRIQASSKGGIDYSVKAAEISRFKGLPSAMIASFPCAAVFWLSYEFAKYHLHNAGTFGFSMNNMLAASFAECSQALVRNPFEVIKQNMQIGAGSSMSGVIAELYQH